jgi:hypothetical protein
MPPRVDVPSTPSRVAGTPGTPSRVARYPSHDQETTLSEKSVSLPLTTSELIDRVLVACHTAVLLLNAYYAFHHLSSRPSPADVVDAVEKATALLVMLPLWMLMVRTRKLAPAIDRALQMATQDAEERMARIEEMNARTHSYIVRQHDLATAMHKEIISKIDRRGIRIDEPDSDEPYTDSPKEWDKDRGVS